MHGSKGEAASPAGIEVIITACGWGDVDAQDESAAAHSPSFDNRIMFIMPPLKFSQHYLLHM